MTRKKLLLAAWLVVVVWSYAKTRIPVDHRVDEALDLAVTAETGSVFRVADYTDYPWTRLCIIAAYSRRVDAQAVTGALWHYWWIPQLHDGQSRLILIDADTVVGLATSDNHALSFSNQALGCYSPDSASFRIEERQFRGATYRELVPL